MLASAPRVTLQARQRSRQVTFGLRQCDRSSGCGRGPGACASVTRRSTARSAGTRAPEDVGDDPAPEGLRHDIGRHLTDFLWSGVAEEDMSRQCKPPSGSSVPFEDEELLHP